MLIIYIIRVYALTGWFINAQFHPRSSRFWYGSGFLWTYMNRNDADVCLLELKHQYFAASVDLSLFFSKINFFCWNWLKMIRWPSLHEAFWLSNHLWMRFGPRRFSSILWIRFFWRSEPESWVKSGLKHFYRLCHIWLHRSLKPRGFKLFRCFCSSVWYLIINTL